MLTSEGQCVHEMRQQALRDGSASNVGSGGDERVEDPQASSKLIELESCVWGRSVGALPNLEFL